jgi:transposase-like protein
MDTVTVTELAKEMGISRRATWYWIDKLGLGATKIGATGMVVLSDAEIELIKENVHRMQKMPGVSVADLVTELGMTRQGLWRIIRKLGLRKSNNVGRSVKFNAEEAELIRSQVNRAD